MSTLPDNYHFILGHPGTVCHPIAFGRKKKFPAFPVWRVIQSYTRVMEREKK